MSRRRPKSDPGAGSTGPAAETSPARPEPARPEQSRRVEGLRCERSDHASGRFLRVDLHNHTHYSPDSILSPERLVREARRRGIDWVAVTDHNTIRGAAAVQELGVVRVIVGEEVRSRDGEILGLFLTEQVPRDLPVLETIDLIKAQGGLVGVPHPLDHLRSALRHDLMIDLIGRIDFIEALNARIVFPSHNRRALELARKHGLAASAGSDAHSPWEVGRAYVEMPDFDGPGEFLEALRRGRLAGSLSSPLVHMISRYAVLKRWLGWSPS